MNLKKSCPQCSLPCPARARFCPSCGISFLRMKQARAAEESEIPDLLTEPDLFGSGRTRGYHRRARPKTVAGPVGGTLLLIFAIFWLCDTGFTTTKAVAPVFLAYISIHAIVIGLRPRRSRPATSRRIR